MNLLGPISAAEGGKNSKRKAQAHDSKRLNRLWPGSVSDKPPLLLQVFASFDAGGAQTRFLALANHFGRALRHVVVAMDRHYGAYAGLEAEADVTTLDVTVKKGSTLANIGAFRQVVAELKPDILITHNWGTIEWAMANWPKRVRHIHMEDGFGVDEAQRQLTRRAWTRRLLLKNSTVVVPSRTLQRIAREIWRLNGKSVHYIPNGIDCARFTAPPDPLLVGEWPATGPKIGIVAALRSEKNIQRLIRAFAIVVAQMPCQLVIIGEGPERRLLERTAAELGVEAKVHFTGHIAGTERVYGGLDIFALTSDTEQMPYTVLEAMAAGLPVVATDVGDIRDMVAPENRPYVVAPDDGALANALRALLSDDALRKQIGNANRQMAFAAYDQSAMFRAYGDLYGMGLGR